MDRPPDSVFSDGAGVNVIKLLYFVTDAEIKSVRMFIRLSFPAKPNTCEWRTFQSRVGSENIK